MALLCVFLISASRRLIWSLHSEQTCGPAASICPLAPSLKERWRKVLFSARSFHSDLMRRMNMYNSNNIIVLMVIGLMPACSSQKQMAITLPSSGCWDRPPLLKMSATINTLILYRQKWARAELHWSHIVHKPAGELPYFLCRGKKKNTFIFCWWWTERTETRIRHFSRNWNN